MSNKESPRNTLLPETPPHPSKFARTKRAWLLVGITGVFCALLIGLLFSLSDRTPAKTTLKKSADVINLLDAPTKAPAEPVDISSPDVGVTLDLGGWIQQTDSSGSLSQQYRCTSLDPSPANMPVGWIEMTDPDVELYLSKSRVVRITGDTAIANAPKRALESGDIYGNVRIELFEGDVIDTENDIPSIVLTTPQASFDNFLGELVCESEVRIVSSNRSSLVGRELSLRFNDTNGRIEYLRLEEVDAITLYQTKTPTLPVPESRVLRTNSRNTLRTKSRHIRAGALPNNDQYYLLELFDHVIIKQGDLLKGKEGRGNRMTLAFALGNTNTSQVTLANSNSPLSAEALLIASFFAMTSDVMPDKQGDIQLHGEQIPVVITCEGGMTMLPIEDAALMPSLPEESRIEIFGNPAILIDHEANMSARASKVRYEVEQQRTDLFGDGETPAIVSMTNTTTYANHLWVSQRSGLGKIVGEGVLEQNVDTGVQTTITWQGGVDFKMTPSDENSDGGVLEQVICRDEIIMKTEESTLTCEELDIRFAADGQGASSPNLAIATGNVKGISDTQTLWADIAEVTFVETVDDPINSPDSFGGTLQADKMTATGDVQLLLNDGGRAFCKTLRGDINQSIAELEGNVLIAYKRMLMDRGDDALFRINRTTGKGLWEGSGQARFLTQPLKVNGDSRMDRPVLKIDAENSVDNPEAQHVSMKTTWEDSMALDQKFNDDAGLVDFRGEVVARSRQSSVELTEIHSESLQLEFTKEPLANGPQENVERRLERVIARDHAKFEHRLWNKENPNQLPVVYYIGGNHIEYETDTSELLAVGNGVLLIRDERKPLQSTHQSSLAGRGTTKFTWDGNLRTTQITHSLYRINMTDNVQMLHKGLDSTVGMLTANNMKALSLNTSASDEKDKSSVSMRGMDVQEIQAEGNVYVSTATRRVDCDLFDYNLQTGLAKLSALQGRTVAIVTEGTPYPVRATSILWNMDPGIDSISIKGLQGTSTN